MPARCANGPPVAGLSVQVGEGAGLQAANLYG